MRRVPLVVMLLAFLAGCGASADTAPEGRSSGEDSRASSDEIALPTTLAGDLPAEGEDVCTIVDHEAVKPMILVSDISTTPAPFVTRRDSVHGQTVTQASCLFSGQTEPGEGVFGIKATKFDGSPKDWVSRTKETCELTADSAEVMDFGDISLLVCSWSSTIVVEVLTSDGSLQFELTGANSLPESLDAMVRVIRTAAERLAK